MHATESSTRARGPWVSSVEELVSRVRPGSRLGVGGVHLTRAPVVALLALAASGVDDLTFVSWGGGLPLEILLAHGRVPRAEICFSNADVLGPAPRFRRAAESGDLAVEDVTALQLLTGLRASAENLRWGVMQEPTGSDFADADRRIEDQPPTARVPARGVDVLLLHAQAADDDGNVRIEGARATDLSMILAARHVLVTVEEQVGREDLATPRALVIPRSHVTSVALAPGGAYPTSCLPMYPADLAAVQWALGAATGEEMRARLAPPATAVGSELRRSGALDAGLVSEEIRRSRAHLAEGDWTVDELMVCWLARTVDNESICTCGSAAPLPVAAYMLAKRTHAREALVMSANSGFVDISERPLSLGLAEQQDFQSAPVHAGADDSYRWYYQPGRVTHEVVGSAQVDAYGATNNVWIDIPGGGRVRLPGQGGMADVANLHRDLVIYLPRHRPQCTPERVGSVSARRGWTDPDLRRALGYQHGRTVVLTNLCVMEPAGPQNRLHVTSLHPGVGMDEVREATGFAIDAADGCTQTAPPTPEELRMLREQVDPLGVRRLDFVPARERAPLIAQILKAEADVVRRLLDPCTAPHVAAGDPSRK